MTVVPMPSPRSVLAACSAVVALTIAMGCDRKKPTQPPQPKPEVTTKPFVVDDPFPDEATLEAIVARPAPEPTQMFGRPVSPVDTWTMKGPGAELTPAASYEGDRVSALSAKAFEGDTEGRIATPGMQCAAAEFGHFVLIHGAEPAADVQAFILARCGALASNVALTVDQLERDQAPKAAFTNKALKLLFERMAKTYPPEVSVGLWAGRNDGGGVLVRVIGTPAVELEPVATASGHGGHVDLRGTVNLDAETVVGYATVGERGYSVCTPIPGTAERAPRFALRCHVDPNDERSMIELEATPRGRLLSKRALRILVSPRGVSPDVYQAPQLSLPIGGQRDSVAWTAAVNALRHDVELPPVTLAAGQTEVAEALLPHLLAALQDSSQDALVNQITLGLIAGRKVDEVVGGGTFFLTSAPRAWSLERELAAELQSPHARSKIFDPNLGTLAVASVDNDDSQMRSSVLAGYTVLQDRNYSREVAAFFDSVDRHRVARGLEPVVRVEGLRDHKTLETYAGRVRDGHLAPAQALDGLLEHFSTETQRDFYGLMLAPYSFVGWEPELEGTLIEAERVAVAVTITHFVPEGATWGRHLVLVMFTKL